MRRKVIFSLCKFYNTNGGIEYVSKNINDVLKNKNFFLNIIYFGKNDQFITNKNEVLNENKINFTLFSQPFSKNYFLNIFKQKYNKCDIVHLHYPNILASVAILLKFTKLNLITHWHSDILNQGFLNILGGLIGFLIALKSKRIVCTTREYAKKSIILKIFKNKIDIIPIFVKPIKINKVSKKNFNKIIFIGRLVKYKGIKYLIKSLIFLPSKYKLLIIGDGPQYLNLKKIIKKLDLNSRVKILKNCSDKKKYELLQKSDLLCLPSTTRQEAFGVVLLEAMMLKKPIVTTYLEGSGLIEVNKNNFSGLWFERKNSEMLAQTIIKIYSKYSYFSKNAFFRYKKFYSQKIVEKKIYKYFKKYS
jgi:glycosyltransferase involved in cell wall biosynthesis